MPIDFWSRRVKNVENKRVEDVYDFTNTDKYVSPFWTLKLACPIKLKDDKSNLKKAHRVFKASTLKEGKYWQDVQELAQWDPILIVSFQEDA